MKTNQNSNPVVKIAGLSKRHGQTQALDNISLTIPPGVVFALLGENGAGKSTTLKTLLGLEKPDSGTAEVLGMSCHSDGIKIRSTVGYVPESPALYDWMAVKETGWFAAGFYGDTFMTEFERLAAEFDLPLDRKIKKLSKGGRAKVSTRTYGCLSSQQSLPDTPRRGNGPDHGWQRPRIAATIWFRFWFQCLCLWLCRLRSFITERRNSPPSEWNRIILLNGIMELCWTKEVARRTTGACNALNLATKLNVSRRRHYTEPRLNFTKAT